MNKPQIMRIQVNATSVSGNEKPLVFLYIKSPLANLEHQKHGDISHFKIHPAKSVCIPIRIKSDFFQAVCRINHYASR